MRDVYQPKLATSLAPGAARQSLIESLFREVQTRPADGLVPRPPLPARDSTRSVIPQRLRDTGVSRTLPPRTPPAPQLPHVTTPLADLAKRAHSDHDVVAERGFEELIDKDPSASLLTSEVRPGAGPRVSASYRTPSGYFLELLTDRERSSPTKAQGYRIFRPSADNPNTTAELCERHFDATSRYALFLDQKTITHLEGYRQLTEVRRNRDDSFSHSRVEKLVQNGFDPVQAEPHLVSSPGFARYLGMLDAVARVEYTRIQQTTSRRESPAERPVQAKRPEQPVEAPPPEAPPEPPPPPPAGEAPQGPIKSINPVAVLLLELSLMTSDLPNLPVDGVYEVLRSPDGLYLQMFVPLQGRRVLTIHSSRGDLLFYEEDEDDEQAPYQTHRRMALDVPARRQRWEKRRLLQGRCVSEEERSATWAEASHLGEDGRESSRSIKRVRRYANGVVMRQTEEQQPPRLEMTRELRQGDAIVVLESRADLADTGCVNRSYPQREASGQEIRRREGDLETRTGSFATQGQTAMEYNIRRVALYGLLHQVTTWSLPRLGEDGEIVLSVDNRRRSAARRRRRRAAVNMPASEWAPAEARGFMVRDHAPSLYVTCRWEVAMSDDEPSEDAASEPFWNAEEGLRWHLAEQVETLRTEGTCAGPRGAVWQYVDVVTHRLWNGDYGELTHRIDVSSERFSPNGRETVRRVRYQDGRRIGEAAGRYRSMTATRAAETWAGERGSGLLTLLGSGRLTMERVEGRPHATELHTFVGDAPALAVLRLQQAPRLLWMLRNSGAVQAFRDGSRNSAWATRWQDGERCRAELMVDLPDAIPPLQGELREVSADACNREALDELLAAFKVESWDALTVVNPTVAEFDGRLGQRNDLSILIRTLDGADDVGLICQGERVQLKTPEGDVLVLLRRGMMTVPFAWMRGADGREHVTVPHDHRTALLVLSADESGVYAELHGAGEERAGRQSLGRLEACPDGLLAWLAQPNARPVLDGFMQRAADFARGVDGVSRYPGPDEHLVASVLWDFSRLAWGEHPDQALPAEMSAIQMLGLTGVAPLEAACALMAYAGSDQRAYDAEAIAPLSIPQEA